MINNNNNNVELLERYECPVCFDYFDETTVAVVPCGHEFHSGCIDNLNEKICPLCREIFNSYHPAWNTRNTATILNKKIEEIDAPQDFPKTILCKLSSLTGFSLRVKQINVSEQACAVKLYKEIAEGLYRLPCSQTITTFRIATKDGNGKFTYIPFSLEQPIKDYADENNQMNVTVIENVGTGPTFLNSHPDIRDKVFEMLFLPPGMLTADDIWGGPNNSNKAWIKEVIANMYYHLLDQKIKNTLTQLENN